MFMETHHFSKAAWRLGSSQSSKTSPKLTFLVVLEL
jgi:hypothetical protein